MTEPGFDDPRVQQGIDLFNSGQYFDCHDVFEDYWSELTCAEKSLFQGLIQAAVALFHFEEGNLGGALRMYSSSRMPATRFTYG
jgi:predicted metal-dependent hydrolase